ncbi:MAG: helix-turn-helix domain-containing protein [Deltaproteobacteria bacterium]|nr:helix-turn-helix domain-containing protein [Deltaproteobacteria bacterium]
MRFLPSLFWKGERMRGKNDLALRIGGRLKGLRKSMGLSLKQLAAATNLSPPLFSRIENGLLMPSIPTLQTISDILKVDLSYFFKKEEDRGYVITRQGNRKMTYSKRGDKKKVIYGLELLVEGMENPFMEPCIVTEFAGPDEDFPLARHDGQEFIYVLEGKLELTLGEKKYTLNKGDAAYFIGEIPHGGKSLSKKQTRTINVHLIPGTRIGTFQTTG